MNIKLITNANGKQIVLSDGIDFIASWDSIGVPELVAVIENDRAHSMLCDILESTKDHGAASKQNDIKSALGIRN